MRPEDQRSPDRRYTVVPRTLIFLTRGSDILLLKGASDKPLWADRWNGIGGHVEPGETPYTSARRELREETGLEVEHLELRGVVHITLPTPPGVVLFVFVGEGDGEPLISDEGEARWIRRDRLPHLTLVEDLPHLLPRILKPGPVVFANYAVTEAGLEISFDQD